jgi:rieske iron-sulfur protein
VTELKQDEPSNFDKNALTRRDFLKLLAAGGVALTFTPFVPWGQFMPNPDNSVPGKQQVVLSDGTNANINTFPVNHSEIVIYPSTTDTVLNSEPFRQWQLIRLPAELGGSATDVTAFRVYSMVCLHLWCLWRYVPSTPQEAANNGQCPCHGSMYNPLNGKAFAGPASLQASPSNVLATLYLEADSENYLWIKPANWSLYENGIVGYGRFLST